MNDEGKLIAVTKTSSRGTSIRMTLPKVIAIELDMEEGDHLGFYRNEDGIFLKKVH